MPSWTSASAARRLLTVKLGCGRCILGSVCQFLVMLSQRQRNSIKIVLSFACRSVMT
jgi:hypothetical protein